MQFVHRNDNRIILLGISLLFFNSPLVAQNDYPVGVIPRFTANGVDSLVHILKSDDEAWHIKALKRYFKKTYTEKLPDIIVYFDSNKVKQALVQYNKLLKNGKLIGEKYIYVVIFAQIPKDSAKTKQKSETRAKNNNNEKMQLLFENLSGNTFQLVLPESKSKKPAKNTEKEYTLTVRRASLVRRPDPFLRQTLTVFGQFLADIKTTDDKKDIAESNNKVTLHNICQEPDKRNLYFGMTHMEIAENAWTRVSVIDSSRKVLPKNIDRIVHNFGNASYNPLTIGLSFGASLCAPEDSTQALKELRSNLYMYTSYYLSRPAPPSGIKWGTFLGTSIVPHGFLNDIIIGFMVSDINRGWPALMFGGSFFQSESKKKMWFFFGVGLDF